MPGPPTSLRSDRRPPDTVPAPIGWARSRLDEADAAGLLRRPRTRQGGSTTSAVVDGRPAVVFSSNDYLGLATHPAVRRAAADAAMALGVGSTGSRHLSGCHEAIARLEDEVSDFLGCASATLAPTGHAANLAVLCALGGRDAVIMSDERNHASIVDGCRLSRARVEVYPHGDLEQLERLLRRADGRPLIVSDTVFSMDGTVADVVALAGLARRYDAWLVLDEAHGLGTVGPGGRGAAAAAGIDGAEDRLVRVVTFGKALGAGGAAVCGAPEVRGLLLQRGRSLIFSTALANPLVAAARAALEVLRRTPSLVGTLHDRTARLRAALAVLAPGGEPPLPIVPIAVGDPLRAVALEAALLDRGQLVQAVRPPTVPPGGSRLRVSVSAIHTEAEIDAVAAALVDAVAIVGPGG